MISFYWCLGVYESALTNHRVGHRVGCVGWLASAPNVRALHRVGYTW